jgi:hypothetical protein
MTPNTLPIHSTARRTLSRAHVAQSAGWRPERRRTSWPGVILVIIGGSLAISGFALLSLYWLDAIVRAAA